MDTLDISDTIRIPMSEIEISAIRSQGAGGQNVNKLATAIHLRFDIAGSNSLPEHLRRKLLHTSDHRISDEGVVVIKAQTFRSQARNRDAALSRLRELLASALREPKRRIPTRVSNTVKQKRLDTKSRRGALKKSRRPVADD